MCQSTTWSAGLTPSGRRSNCALTITQPRSLGRLREAIIERPRLCHRTLGNRSPVSRLRTEAQNAVIDTAAERICISALIQHVSGELGQGDQDFVIEATQLDIMLGHHGVERVVV